MSENFAELFEQSLEQNQLKLSNGDLITGNVMAITKEFVIVNVGLKSEGVISIDQFKNAQGELEVGVGDNVDVVIEAYEDGAGVTHVSREKAKRAEEWRLLEKAQEAGESVTGRVSGKVKGGFTVELNAVRAFLPGSLVDIRPVRDTSHIEGHTLEFKIIKLDQKRNNIVVSRRAVLESATSEEREALLDKLEEGQEITGIVKNLTDYGAFVDLGGIDGLLHVTDMSWKRVKHPNEVVKVGQELKLKVLKFDRERQRVSLGIKQMGEDPWHGIERRYPIGTRVFGKVTNVADYGCFVEIEDGVEGLVHVSEMDWTNKNVNPYKVVQLGDETEVMVLEVDEGRRRISLGIKQCVPNPWNEFANGHQVGDRIKGTIKSITDFGIFIGLEGGIDGLIHLSDISWNESGEEAVRHFKKGDEVEACVLAIDPDKERISLGVKQLQDDPHADFYESYKKGSIVNGKVVEVDAKKAMVDLGSGLLASLRASEIAKEKVTDAREVLNVGDEIEAKIINIDRKNRSIAISIKAKETQEEAESLKTYGSKAEGSGATLGDLLKEKIENKGSTE